MFSKRVILIIFVGMFLITAVSCMNKADSSKTNETLTSFSVSDIQEIVINSDIWDDFNDYKPIEMKFAEISDLEVIKNCDNNLKVNIDKALDKFMDTNISYAKFEIKYKLKDNKTYQSNYTIPMDNEYTYLAEMLNLSSLKKQLYPIFRTDISSISCINFSSDKNDDPNKKLKVTDREQINSIIDYMKKSYLDNKIYFKFEPSQSYILVEMMGYNNDILIRTILPPDNDISFYKKVVPKIDEIF